MRSFFVVVALLGACASTRHTPESVGSVKDVQLCRLTHPDHPTIDHELLAGEVVRRGLDCASQHTAMDQSAALARLAPPQARQLPMCPVRTGNSVMDSFVAGRAASGQCTPPGVARPDVSSGRVCLIYTATRRAYQVEGELFTGAELNAAMNTNEFGGFARYLVVFWGPGEAAIIEAPNLLGRSMPSMPTDGFDRQGRAWQFYANTGYCAA